jgi:pilus assembly protein FimV
MANAVADKKKIEEDEFGIHGDLATSGAGGDDFVVLYDSSQEGHAAEPPAPSLDDLNEEHALETAPAPHAEDAYIDDILSSDDIETAEPAAPAAFAPLHAEEHAEHAVDDDGPIALSSEELDGILEMGPEAEEEFHPDFPVEGAQQAEASHDEAPAPVLDPEEPADFELPPADADDSAFDDDELPIAISDEDLDEILLEEETADLPPTPAGRSVENAAPPAAHEPAHEAEISSPAPSDFFEASHDEEPIALSDDELDNILADAEADHSEEIAPGIEDEILTLDEDPEITLIDDAGLDHGASHEEATHDREAAGAGSSFFDSDEDEPITLSDEELDGILSSAPEEEHKTTDEVALESTPAGDGLEVEDDEPVSLSNEELDGILMDADEPTEGLAELPPEHDADASVAEHKDFFDADDDEPIALSADELDGIAATAVEEEAPPAAGAGLAELPPEEAADFGESEQDSLLAPGDEPSEIIDERYSDIDSMADAPAADAQPESAAGEGEDDGPIALSADELDGIAADAHEVTPEAPMVPLAPLDAGGHEPSLAENTDKPATVFEEDLEAATLIHEDDKAAAAAPAPDTEELKSVMGYLDNLLGELPDDVIEKFAQSEYFKLYQKIMDKLGI